MEKNYKDLITAKRRRKSTREARSLTEEAESDRARLLFSSPFRRLQQKAQVFSLEDNSAVRSRLTHSFEVSQNGRYLAQKVLQGFNTKQYLKMPSRIPSKN